MGANREPAYENEVIEDFFRHVADEGKGWWKAEKRLLLLQGSLKLGKAIGFLLSMLITAIALALVLVFASVALAIWLGHLLGSLALGFLCTAGIYLVLYLVFHFFLRAALANSLALNIINALYHGDD